MAKSLFERCGRLLEGDLRPFEQLMLRYQKRVIANCRYITHDTNNAEDLAQEVMVKVFFAINSFEGKSSLSISYISPCLPYEVLKMNTNEHQCIDRTRPELVSA